MLHYTNSQFNWTQIDVALYHQSIQLKLNSIRIDVALYQYSIQIDFVLYQ